MKLWQIDFVCIYVKVERLQRETQLKLRVILKVIKGVVFMSVFTNNHELS